MSGASRSHRFRPDGRPQPHLRDEGVIDGLRLDEQRVYAPRLGAQQVPEHTGYVIPGGWPPTDEQRAAAKMRDAAFVLVLRAWLLRKRAERVIAETKETPRETPRRAQPK
jgi:hypothetical protein